MGTMRKKYPVAFKAKVALEAIKEEKTSAELASQYGVHPAQIRWWKKIVKDQVNELFTDNHQHKDKKKNLLIEELYKEIGRLKVEADWLKKNVDLPAKEKVILIERPGNIIPIARQAQLLGIARSSVYYEPTVDIYTLELMRLIDEEYTKYGSRKITAVLKRAGYEVNRKRVQRLMRLMLCGAYHNISYVEYPFMWSNP